MEGKYPFGDLGGSALGTAGKGETTTQIVTGGFNYTLSPTFIFDGVFGYTRMDQFVGIPNVDKNVGLDVWKIPGTNGGKQYANDTRYGGAPNITGFGFSDIGFIDTWTPVWRHERSYTYTSNFSKIHGAHEIRFGVETRRLELNHWQPETANPRGADHLRQRRHQRLVADRAHAEHLCRGAARAWSTRTAKSIQYFEMKTREWQLACLRPRPLAGQPQADHQPRACATNTTR